jgi:uncharacterized protein (TIGR00299 family) protein
VSRAPVTGRIAFLDAPSGIAGDMLLGALVDAGLPLEVLEAVPRALGLAGVEVLARRVTRGVLAATKVDVRVDGHEEGPPQPGAHPHVHPHEHPHHVHRHHEHEPHEHEPHEHEPHEHEPHERQDHGHPPHDPAPSHGRSPAAVPGHGAPHPDRPHAHRAYRDIAALLEGVRALPAAALSDARRVFRALAEAEARVHGVRVDDVRFHEVGAADALVDIVGGCVGLRALGVDEVRTGPLPWPGGGTVATAHGRLALPAPATALLLVGQPTFPSGETFEQVTPTGAALVSGLSRGTGVPAGFVPRAIGLGAGSRDGGRLPNVLRLVLGDLGAPGEAQDAVLLETNLDDATGQVLARAIERAMAAGALDAWAVAAVMKKGRPGHVLSVLARPEDASRLEAVLFEETPTLGVRRHAVARTTLARHHVEVQTRFGGVRMKVRSGARGPEATPEHDDCRRLAEAHGVALREVLDAAQRAWATHA